MRPSIARATLRAASSLVTRNQPRTSALPSGRTCTTSAITNDPVVKHSSVSSSQQQSSTDALRSSNTTSSALSDDRIRTSSTLSTDPSTSTTVTATAVGTTNVTLASATSSSSSSDQQQKQQQHVIKSSPTTASTVARTDDNSDPSLSTSSTATITAVDSDVDLDSTLSSEDMAVNDVSAVHESAGEADDTSSKSGFIAPGETPEELVSQIRGYLRRNAVRSALFHFISALKVDNAPSVDPSVLKLVLPVLGRQGWAPTALDAIDLALSREYNLEVGLYNCALHAMARSGDYDTIQSVIKRMWSLPMESRPNATSYNYLIGSFMYRGAVDKAFEVLHDMKKHMIYPTFATYHALISGCLRSNDPRRAYTTLNAVERQRFDIGAMTISQVLVSCADADLTDEVANLLPRLEEALPRYVNEVHRIAEKRQAYRMPSSVKSKTATTPEERAQVRGSPRLELGAIASIMHCAFRNCRSDLALSGWSLLRKYYPDAHIPETLWYCLIGAFAGSGQFNKAFEVLGAMREQGYEPRLKDLDMALIRPLSLEIAKVDEQYYRLCDKAKGVDTSEQGNGSKDEVRDVMEATTHSEGEISATTAGEVDSVVVKDTEAVGKEEISNVPVIEGQGNENEAGMAASSVTGEEALAQEEIKGSDDSLRHVLSNHPDATSTDEYWKELKCSTVGIEELNCVIAACSYAGDLDRAFQTYDEVESVFGLEKNVETFNALLEGCIQVKHVRGGLRIVSEMEKIGLALQEESLQLMVRLLTRGSRAEECIDLVKKVRDQGGKVSLQTYLLLIRYFVRGDNLDAAVELYTLGMQDGFESRTLRGRLDNDGLGKLKRALGEEYHPPQEQQRRGQREEHLSGNVADGDKDDEGEGEESTSGEPLTR